MFGASGRQGGGVVRALMERGEFRVRALTRNPEKHPNLGDEVVAADLDRPETLRAALEGAHGVFLVTNFWEEGTDETRQATVAIEVAREAAVDHFIWSTLPDVEAISGGELDMPHFTGKARIDAVVATAGFPHHSFVVAPFFYQNFQDALVPQKLEDGSMGFALPIDPARRVIHMGDVTELGDIVAGTFADPGETGDGAYLPLVGDFMSFDDILATLREQGQDLSFRQVPHAVFATLFPGAAELAATFAHFEAHTYLGPEPHDAEIALANKVAGKRPTPFADWAKTNLPPQAG